MIETEHKAIPKALNTVMLSPVMIMANMICNNSFAEPNTVNVNEDEVSTTFISDNIKAIDKSAPPNNIIIKVLTSSAEEELMNLVNPGSSMMKKIGRIL